MDNIPEKMDKKSVTIKKGDLLKNDSQYICHQTNTKTTKGKGLSEAMFKGFPWSDVYTSRGVYTDNKDRTPGTIEVRGDGKDKRFVVAMYAQRYPGPPKWANDTVEMREAWFQQCLGLVETLKSTSDKPKTVAFPERIGCGLAGGDWNHYLAYIEEELSCKVTICSLD